MRTIGKVIAIVALAAAATVFAQDKMSLAEARAKIGECIKTPTLMTETIKKLSPEDQKTFLAEVNEAISKMPGSNEFLTATYLNVNRAALKGAQPGNLSTLVAEVFATVPPEALVVLNERFAADLFNRASDPSVTYTDEQYVQLAKSLMEKVNERTASLENGDVRSTFAILMLVRASNGSPADLADTLADTLPVDSRQKARTEWIPPALAEGSEKTYEPLLGDSGSSGSVPATEVVMRIAGPQLLDALLGDIVEGVPGIYPIFNQEQTSGSALRESATDAGVVPSGARQSVETVEPTVEPHGYPGQY